MSTRKAAKSKSQERGFKTAKSSKNKAVASKRNASGQAARRATTRPGTSGSNQVKSKDKAKKTKAKQAKVSKKATKPAGNKAKGPSKAGKTPTKTRQPSRKKSPPAPKVSKAGRSTKGAPSKKDTRASNFGAALKVYEAALKLMRAESFDKAKAKFGELIQRFSTEIGLADRANLLIQACDKRIREKRSTRPKLKTVDDFYDLAVGEMNSRRLEVALDHLHSALNRAPESDYVLYAIAAASALSDQREDALEYLRKAIQSRDQNRFQAANDSDFESLFEDSEFIKLIRLEES